MPGSGQPGINGALLKLFGATTGFSAKAEVRMLDDAGKETLGMEMDFAVLEGKVRAELDMSQVKSAEVKTEDLARLKQLGLDRVVTIVRPDKKSALVIYPALQAYTEAPMTPEAAAEMTADYKVQRTLLVKETIDRHPCEKCKVLLTGPKRDRQEAVVWFATDLKDFPVKVQLLQPDATVVMQFKDIKLSRPDAKLFGTPPATTKYPSVEALMRSKVPQSGR
jgi:hypothetical protein